MNRSDKQIGPSSWRARFPLIAAVFFGLLTILMGFVFPRWTERFWVGWEAAALVGTLGYAAFVFFDWFFFGDTLDDILRSWANGLAAIFGIAGIGCYALALFFAAVKPEWVPRCIPTLASLARFLEPYWLVSHGGSLFGGAVCFLLINVIIVFYPKPGFQRKKEYTDRRVGAVETIWSSDVPTVVVFLTISFFFLFWPHNTSGAEHQELAAFLGGCVAFQLLASNVTFAWGQRRKDIDAAAGTKGEEQNESDRPFAHGL